MNGVADVVVPGLQAHPGPRKFNVDDAFFDGDEDDDLSRRFDSSTIREDILKSHNAPVTEIQAQEDAEDLNGTIGLSQEPEASISSFDLDGRDSLSPPTEHSSPESHNSETQSPTRRSPPRAQGMDRSDSYFSEVSLGEDRHNEVEEATPEADNTREEASEAHPNVVQVETLESGDAETSHPNHSEASLQQPYTPEDISRLSISDQEVEARSPNSAPASTAHSRSQSLAPSPALAVSTSHPQLPPEPPLHSSNTSRPQSFAKPPTHRTAKSGPSILEKVVSKTRPPFLPPKNHEEDKKHAAEWEDMMRRSRIAEEKRRKALQERRIAREKKVEDSLHVWERELLPDWKAVHKNPALRRLWWSGIPTKLRASMWEKAVGNPLALSKDSYRTCLARAKRALASNTFPTTTLGLIEEDIKSTLPSLHIFLSGMGPLYQDLKDMLCAWVVARSDEGLGYVMGIAKIAGMFLINMPAPQGFVVMRNLLERHCLRSFYGGLSAKDDVEAYYRIFDTLLADGMPKIYFNFKQHHISPASYLPEWLIPLFLDHLPFEACARIWDVIVLEGDAFLYRAALAILAVLEPRLFFPDRRELLELLRGESKAALEVAKREGRPLDGGKYEVYGVDEETLWDRIDAMDEWWKESTWNRLIQRELPDI